MRDIKFRAWNKAAKCMYPNEHFALTMDGDELQLMPECEHYNKPYLPNSGNMIYMQYTGLTDKNGTPIYEGDIVKVGYECYSSEDDNGNEIDLYEEEWVQAVKYESGSGYELHAPDGHYFFGEFSSTTLGWGLDSGEYEVEVIGNIYENKELLK